MCVCGGDQVSMSLGGWGSGCGLVTPPLPLSLLSLAEFIAYTKGTRQREEKSRGEETAGNTPHLPALAAAMAEVHPLHNIRSVSSGVLGLHFILPSPPSLSLSEWKPPAAIDNTPLLQQGTGGPPGKRTLTLAKGVAYRRVSLEVWQLFQLSYGGGPTILTTSHHSHQTPS